jgi:glycosyltransferase involved in cell wall biosynthesis
MKLLLTTLSLDLKRGSGSAQRTRYLSRYLVRAGAACAVAAMDDGDIACELRKSGVPVYTTGHVRLPYHLPLLNPRRLSGLVRWSDAVHILGYWNLLSIFVAALARWHNRPYLLCAAGEFAALQQRSAVKRSFHRLLGRKMIAGAHTIIAITDLEKRQIIDWLGVAAERILILPNGVEEVGVAATAEERTRPSSVLFMGRLATIKGPDLLLEAFGRVAERFPDVRLTIAGPDGGLLDELEQRCAQLALRGRVTFSGFLDEAARKAAYRDALLVVVPSRDEAMSLVALEAGAQAKPLLVTDRCGLDEVARLGGGEIVNATVPALADALTRLLADRDRLSAMGVRMRAHVSAHYAWPRVARGLMQHLGEIPVGPPTCKGFNSDH